MRRNETALPLDPFAQMRAAQERVNELREQAERWIASPPDPDGSRFHTIPASPDDVFWLCDRLDAVLTVMQDATHTYGIVDTNRSPIESITPMMVERDALAEAVSGVSEKRDVTALPLEDRYAHTYRCEACDGDGYKWVEDSDGRDYPVAIPCSRCGGTGELRVDGKDDPS